MPPFHTATAAALASSPEGQPQNLGVSGRDEALSIPCHGAQLCIWDIEAQPKSFSSKTYSVSQGQEVLTCRAEGTMCCSKLQTWSPDLPKGNAPSLACLRCISDPGNNKALGGHPVRSHAQR